MNQRCAHNRMGLGLSSRSVLVMTVLLLTITQGLARGQDETAALLARITWTSGPATVQLGQIAQLELPSGYRYTGQAGARLWMEATGNPPDNSMLGVIIPPPEQFDTPAGGWSMTFAFAPIGYVNDDDKDSLTAAAADAFLEAIRKNTVAENRERQRRGWTTLNVDGWALPPFYDTLTHNLTWAIRGSSTEEVIVNYDSRILCRRGMMMVKMVAPVEQFESFVPTYRKIVSGVRFSSGEKYSEFREGDKIAQYGLVGLITGGTTVAVVKSWKPLLKMGAIIVAVIAAIAAKLKSPFGSPAVTADAGSIPETPSSPDDGEGGSATTMRCTHCGQINRVRTDVPAATPHCGRCHHLL